MVIFNPDQFIIHAQQDNLIESARHHWEGCMLLGRAWLQPPQVRAVGLGFSPCCELSYWECGRSHFAQGFIFACVGRYQSGYEQLKINC